MNAEDLISKLEYMGFTPEEYDDQLYASGSYNGGSLGREHFDNDKIQSEVGPWVEMEKKDKQQDWTSWSHPPANRTIVLHFPEHDIYIRSDRYEGSYSAQVWTEWRQCFPKKVETTLYEYPEDATESY